jgi:GNAT superfamily N-acetyltransferase
MRAFLGRPYMIRSLIDYQGDLNSTERRSILALGEKAMVHSSTEIRSATFDQLPNAVAAIVTAFLVDPAARFAWPSADTYLKTMPLAIREFTGACFEHKTAYISADLCGAALWLPPRVSPNSEALEKVFRETVKPKHLEDLLATFEKMDQAHPKEAHWYLAMIGVDPKVQGKGLGSDLMRYALSRCDQDHAVAYLETANPRNIPLYERFGFEVMKPFQVGAAPRMVPMLRRPP